MDTRGWTISLLLVGVLMTAKAEAFSAFPFTVTQMAGGAEKIFVGTCTAVEESVNEYGLSVLTVTFAVQEPLKGTLGSTVTFRQLNPVQPPPSQPGVGGLRLDIASFGLPSYTPGEATILFLAKDGRLGLTSPLGLAQGKMPVSVTGDGHKQVTNRALKTESPQNPAIPLPGGTGDQAQFIAAIRTMIQNDK